MHPKHKVSGLGHLYIPLKPYATNQILVFVQLHKLTNQRRAVNFHHLLLQEGDDDCHLLLEERDEKPSSLPVAHHLLLEVENGGKPLTMTIIW